LFTDNIDLIGCVWPLQAPWLKSTSRLKELREYATSMADAKCVPYWVKIAPVCRSSAANKNRKVSYPVLTAKDF